jgi:hypothetical protein
MVAPSHFPDRLYGLALGSATLALWLYPRIADRPRHQALTARLGYPLDHKYARSCRPRIVDMSAMALNAANGGSILAV